jgi:cation:H+ antiporter
MTIIFSLLFAAFGVALLAKGSDFLVDGASAVAKRFGVSPLVIGLTIVSFGTSAPELIVSLTSTLQGSDKIAIANVLGSNIVNILFILGVCAIIKPLTVKSSTVWKEIPLALASAIAVLFLGFAEMFKYSNLANLGNMKAESISGYISFGQGIILLMFFVIYMYYNFGIAKSDVQEEEGEETSNIKLTKGKSILYIVIGLVMLVFGGQSLVYGAVEIAKLIGISERIIGLTIVAIGTSLPELVTSVRATQKGEIDIAVGNVVGSNIFNVFFILGASSLFGVLKLGQGEFIDALVGIGTSLVLFGATFIIKPKQIGRVEGIFMVFLYVCYVTYLIMS